MKHFLGIQNHSRDELKQLLDKSFFFKKFPNQQTIRDRFVANLFFESSTRTKLSFEVAAKKLGANVLNFEPGSSSLTKGESPEDTLNTLSALGVECVAVRHNDDNLLDEIASKVNLSLINAGAGKNEHPSQALLDAMTIHQEFNRLEGLTVSIIGDINHSRVAFSNYHFLTKFGANVIFSGPQNLMPNYGNVLPLEEAIRESDVVMMLRVQFERHLDTSPEKQSYLQNFGLTNKRMNLLKPKSIVMHPAPINRGIEIADELVNHPSSRIFKQMENGVYARMAILDTLMNGRV